MNNNNIETFTVIDYHYEPFSYSIWTLKHEKLCITPFKCAEQLGIDNATIASTGYIKGKIGLDMSTVSVCKDYNKLPFSIIENNFNKSDGSVVRALGKAKNIDELNHRFELESLIDFFIEPENWLSIADGDFVEVIGILKFKPHQNP